MPFLTPSHISCLGPALAVHWPVTLTVWVFSQSPIEFTCMLQSQWEMLYVWGIGPIQGPELTGEEIPIKTQSQNSYLC